MRESIWAENGIPPREKFL